MSDAKVKALEAKLEKAQTELMQQAAIIEQMRSKGAQDAAELKECRDAQLDLTRENARLRALAGKAKP